MVWRRNLHRSHEIAGKGCWRQLTNTNFTLIQHHNKKIQWKMYKPKDRVSNGVANDMQCSSHLRLSIPVENSLPDRRYRFPALLPTPLGALHHQVRQSFQMASTAALPVSSNTFSWYLAIVAGAGTILNVCTLVHISWVIASRANVKWQCQILYVTTLQFQLPSNKVVGSCS